MDYKQLHITAIEELKQYRALETSADPKDQQKAVLIRAAMSGTSEREQFVLEQFYINDEEGRRNGHVDSILSKYEISRTELYRLRDSALTNYCFSMLIAALGGKEEARST
jgi:hypothetical protein